MSSYFILGFPNETVESAKQTINFAVEINADVPVFGIMVPYPGTRIGDMAVGGEGGYVLRSENWNDYNKQIGDALEFEHVDRKVLERLQLMGYLKVFLYNARLSRSRQVLLEIPQGRVDGAAAHASAISRRQPVEEPEFASQGGESMRSACSAFHGDKIRSLILLSSPQAPTIP